MKLTSSAFVQGEKIPVIYTCDGDNVNPPLEITGVPHEAQSLVLIMDDPDVPQNLRKDGMWDHWVVFNIPPDNHTIEEASEPPGVAGIGTNGETGYFGPCPPDREHRYFFKLFALDTLLDLPEKSTKAAVENAMAGHVLFHAELMGTYERI
ncbi:MAG: YbhB/YbcL family Raf kinase inhibitor-like protein [Desulfobacteraceae bacterium]|nr:YbhB/YbcL family Raf kinase inhibitor-like protein [Desulfobacteraceae bacterium]